MKSWQGLKLVICSTLMLAGLAACSSSEYYREKSVKRIAAPVFLLPRKIEVAPFTVQAYERVYEQGAPTMLYIEGDGNDFHTLESDPGPTNPVGLRLATMDGKTNVVYLARPCQLVGEADECPEKFWEEARYSGEVLDAMSRALDNIKAANGVTGFHIVGYDGGAAVGAGLAAVRNDVLSLRTVAGILDTRFYANINNRPSVDNSFNPIELASDLADLPQRHFVGQLDQEVPPALFHSYDQAMGEPNCSEMSLVDNATHEDGWVEQWKVLLSMPLTCSVEVNREVEVYDPAVTIDYDGNKGIGYSK